MKAKILIICAIAVSIFASCDKDTNDRQVSSKKSDVSLKIGEITEIKQGETIGNTQYGLSLTVENINDGRCPIGAMCFWAGNASVQFHLVTAKGEYDFTLDTHYPTPTFVFKNDTVIEDIKYKLMGVLPYPDLGERQQEKTVKILVGGQSMDDSQWKLIRVQDKETLEVNHYPLAIEPPYIIHFKEDFTFAFSLSCNYSQGKYVIGSNGSITFYEFFPGTEMLCGGLSYWEDLVVYNLLQSKKYTITGNQLTIDCEKNSLYFEKY